MTTSARRLGSCGWHVARAGARTAASFALFAIGFVIYGPIMIIGLHALELVPKKAAGTAAGFTGFFGYVFGAAIAGTGIGWIADRWDWNGRFVALALCRVLTMECRALTPGHTPPSRQRGR